MANLSLWFDSHSIPEKEKSFISQLKSGKASFGKKVARRLENSYGMPNMYLDSIETKSSNDHKSIFSIEVLDIMASAGTGYLRSDVQEEIKLIEYDNEQAKLVI